MTDYYEYAIPQLVKLLGARFKDYRLEQCPPAQQHDAEGGLGAVGPHDHDHPQV